MRLSQCPRRTRKKTRMRMRNCRRLADCSYRWTSGNGSFASIFSTSGQSSCCSFPVSRLCLQSMHLCCDCTMDQAHLGGQVRGWFQRQEMNRWKFRELSIYYFRLEIVHVCTYPSCSSPSLLLIFGDFFEDPDSAVASSSICYCSLVSTIT